MTLNSEALKKAYDEFMADKGLGTVESRSTQQALRDAITAYIAALPTGDLVERLKLEAQGHAQEARTANATIYEIYQVISGATGEPGNWHGAQPVRDYVEKTAAHIQALTAERDGLIAALAAESYSHGETGLLAEAAEVRIEQAYKAGFDFAMLTKGDE